MFDPIISLLYHVYVLYTANGVFYVGCGDINRLKGTLVPDPRYHSKKDKKLLECFVKEEVIHQAIVFSTDNRKEALHVETCLIVLYGTCLTNTKQMRRNNEEIFIPQVQDDCDAIDAPQICVDSPMETPEEKEFKEIFHQLMQEPIRNRPRRVLR